MTSETPTTSRSSIGTGPRGSAGLGIKPRSIAPCAHSAGALDRLALAHGERVLDAAARATRRSRSHGTLAGSAEVVGIEVASCWAPVVLCEEGLDAAIDFTLRVGPVYRLIAEQAEPVRELIRQRIRSALAPAATVSTVTLDGAAWLVTARA